MMARRKQPIQERSVATRQRLLDAAFAALNELGYAGTTSSEVCRRAGVSRGTLLYHFPTTADLVTAAAEELFARRLGAFRRAFGEVPAGAGRAAAAVSLLWQELAGPTFYGWVEILGASRRDGALRRKVRRVMEGFGRLVDETFAGMFPGLATPWLEARLVPSIAFPLLNGLALDGIWSDRARVDETVRLLGRLAELLLGASQTTQVAT
jgi:AcrR family transcriptional regulator